MNFRKLLFSLAFLFWLLPGSALGAITWVDNGAGATAGCTGIASCTTTASPVTGDLLLVFVFRDGNNTAPTFPGLWQVLDNTAGSNNNGSAIGYKTASGGAEASGSFTGATSIIIEVYRGVDETKFNGGGPAAEGYAEGALGTITVPSLGTFINNDGTSWVVYACGHRQVDTNIEAATNTGVYTLRQNVVDGTDEAADFDTNGGTSSFGGFTKGLTGTNGGWACRSQELPALGGGSVAGTILDPFGTSGVFGL